MDPAELARAARQSTVLIREEQSHQRQFCQDPGVANSSSEITDSDLAAMRAKFPFLAEFSDGFICSTKPDCLLKMETATLNPLTPKTEKCSDWAENLTTYSSRYSKNFSLYLFIFYLALLKSYRIKCVFNFQTFLTVLFYEFFLENGTLHFSFTSQEFITVEIFEISFTTTEI
jgi:hypothetical protein